MGPCLKCYFIKDSDSKSFISSLLSDLSSENVISSRKEEYWVVFYQNIEYTIAIQKADLEIMIDEFIIENIAYDKVALTNNVFELDICCSTNNKAINDHFVNSFLIKLTKEIKIIGMIGKSEF